MLGKGTHPYGKLESGSPWEVQQVPRIIYKISGSRKMALDLVRSTEKAGSLDPPPRSSKVAESMYKCKHILKFSNCVLLRVPINNNNYEQPIAFFVIIPAKNTLTNQYGVGANRTRFGKSTHISMISNSVTHLRSYTNYAIADIAGNSAPKSPVTPRERRHHRAERWRLRIERRRLHIERQRLRNKPNADVSTSSADVSASSADIVASNKVSWCFTMFYMCFTMFYLFNNVLWCLESRKTIGVAASAPARPPIASGIAITPQKSAITPQKSAMAPQG